MTETNQTASIPAPSTTPRWQEREFLALALVAGLYVWSSYRGEDPAQAEQLRELLMVALPGFMVSRGLAKRSA